MGAVLVKVLLPHLDIAQLPVKARGLYLGREHSLFSALQGQGGLGLLHDSRPQPMAPAVLFHRDPAYMPGVGPVGEHTAAGHGLPAAGHQQFSGIGIALEIKDKFLFPVKDGESLYICYILQKEKIFM